MQFCLTFHGIGTPPSNIPESEKIYWCEVTQAHQILDFVKNRSDVLITSDDGNRSDIEVLAPALLERGLAGIFFVLAGRLDHPNYLQPHDLRELKSMGMEVGLHGWEHVPWRGLSPDAWRREVVDAKARIEDCISSPITAAGCPFGQYERKTIRRLRAANVRQIYTSDGGWSYRDAELRPRSSIRLANPLWFTQKLDARKIGLIDRLRIFIKGCR